jgi:hypothetical protein
VRSLFATLAEERGAMCCDVANPHDYVNQLSPILSNPTVLQRAAESPAPEDSTPKIVQSKDKG